MNSYLLVFVTTGLIAVAIKYVGDHAGSRLAGLVAMVPLKIVIAWALLGSSGGPEAIRAAIPGMATGLIALVVLLTATWFLAARFDVVPTIVLGYLVWLGAAWGLHQIGSAIGAPAPAVEQPDR